jgi:Secretion system C-terminal sorting domain
LGDKPTTVNSLRKFNIAVYPNPATRFIAVSFTDGIFKRPTRYQLFDLAGKLITEGISNVKQFQIDVQKVQRGIYILKLFNGYHLELGTGKVLIQ